MIGAGIDTDERLSHIRARQTALLNVNRELLGAAASPAPNTGLVLGLAMGGLAAVAGAAYAIAGYSSRHRGYFGAHGKSKVWIVATNAEGFVEHMDEPSMAAAQKRMKRLRAVGYEDVRIWPMYQHGRGDGLDGTRTRHSSKHDWRYAPKTVFSLKAGGERPVVRAVVHAPGTHPPGTPLVPHVTALQLITDTGHSRWFGVDDAKINSELRMVARGGFINPVNELAKSWKPCRKGCAGLAGGTEHGIVIIPGSVRRDGKILVTFRYLSTGAKRTRLLTREQLDAEIARNRDSGT